MNLQDTEKTHTLLSFSETGEYSIAVKTANQIAYFLEELANEHAEPLKMFLEGDISSSIFPHQGLMYMVIAGTPVMPKSKQVITKLVL